MQFFGGSGAIGSGANVWNGAQTIQISGIGTTSTDGLVVANNAAALINAQQWSPRIRLTGQAFTGSVSNSADWIFENRTIQSGFAQPLATRLAFAVQQNAGGYTDVMYLNSDPAGLISTTARGYVHITGNFSTASASPNIGLYGLTTNFTCPTGSAYNDFIGCFFQLLPGGSPFVGNGNTRGMQVLNSVAGTGTGALSNPAPGNNANYGSVFQTNGATAGNNVGMLCTASGSTSLNLGGQFIANQGASTLNVGASYVALNGTTNICGLYYLSTSAPVLTSTDQAACWANPAATGSPAFLGRVDAIATAQTAGLSLINTTAAAAGAQQYSPLHTQTGFGWDSTNNLSKQVDFAWQVQPVQGAGAPTGNYVLASRINAGGWTNLWSIGSATGSLTIANPTQATTSTAGTTFTFTGSSAVAGSSVAGAAAGGDITWNVGAAARLTSGNAAGGNFRVVPGAGIGTGAAGYLAIQQPGGTPGTNELQIYHDGTNAQFVNPTGSVGGFVFNTANGHTCRIQDASQQVVIFGSAAAGQGRMQALTGGAVGFSTDFSLNGGNGYVCLAVNTPFGWASGGAGTPDTFMWRAAAKVIKLTDNSGANAGWLQQSAGRARVSSDQTNATATMQTMALTTDGTNPISLIAGRKYTGRMVVKCINSTAADGIQFDFNGGSATMTSFFCGAGILASGGTDVVGVNTSTALATALTFTTFTGESVIIFEISLVCNAAGTFIPEFAEVAHTTGTATVRLGSYIWLEDSPN